MDNGLIPILIIFSLICYPLEMAYLSETSLGKLFCVSLILYYGNQDVIYGLFVCVLVLVYYQVGFLDHILSVERNHLIQESMALMNEAYFAPSSPSSPPSSLEWGSYTTRDPLLRKYEVYGGSPTTMETSLLNRETNAELKAAFRKQNCQGGKLPVRNDLAEHVVFPLSSKERDISTIRFNHEFATCNPCDPRCDFSITRERLAVEEAMQKGKPKDVPIAEDTWFSAFLPFDPFTRFFH